MRNEVSRPDLARFKECTTLEGRNTSWNRFLSFQKSEGINNTAMQPMSFSDLISQESVIISLENKIHIIVTHKLPVAILYNPTLIYLIYQKKPPRHRARGLAIKITQHTRTRKQMYLTLNTKTRKLTNSVLSERYIRYVGYAKNLI